MCTFSCCLSFLHSTFKRQGYLIFCVFFAASIKFPVLHFFPLLFSNSISLTFFYGRIQLSHFPNKKHTLPLNSRGHPHAHVTGQTRSLTFLRGSLLLTGWDLTFFLFVDSSHPRCSPLLFLCFSILFLIFCQIHV